MTGPAAALLPDGRLHLQHGPIDLIIVADGGEGARARAIAAAQARFADLLATLVSELPVLRQAGGGPVAGPVARRMVTAIAPHAARVFVTPMAAVAGAVADEVLAAMLAAAPLTRAHVNNGGDIALHLAPGATYRAAVAVLDGRMPGRIEVRGGDGIGGMATSGLGGRSLSLGIAESVTVLAASAAAADAAATLIANAVDLPGHPAITRARACDLAPDSDLGDRLVTTACGPLTGVEIDRALARGLAEAARMQAEGHIRAALLLLRNRWRILPDPAMPYTLAAPDGVPAHASA